MVSVSEIPFIAKPSTACFAPEAVREEREGALEREALFLTRKSLLPQFSTESASLPGEEAVYVTTL